MVQRHGATTGDSGPDQGEEREGGRRAEEAGEEEGPPGESQGGGTK